jgi:hypothetical protein
MDVQKPSIGRIVHFTDRGHTCAAIVTAVDEDSADQMTVNCTVFLQNGTTMAYGGAQYDHHGTRHGMWRWPPRT